MMNASELKPVFVHGEHKGAGYLYKGKFIPKDAGALSEELLKIAMCQDIDKELNSKHPLVIDRNDIQVSIEPIEWDIKKEWFRIVER